MRTVQERMNQVIAVIPEELRGRAWRGARRSEKDLTMEDRHLATTLRALGLTLKEVDCFLGLSPALGGMGTYRAVKDFRRHQKAILNAARRG
jgi:hypothetical protein